MPDQPSCSELTVLDVVPYGMNGIDSPHQFFALRLSRPAWENWDPGQFLMVRPLSFGLELPWGRPLGICQMDKEHLGCFFQVVGQGTQKLAALRCGEPVLVWGPLGRGFATVQDVPTLLLAGGMGIVPFVGYAQKHPAPENLSLLFGHRQPPDCYPIDAIRKHIAVETLHETSPEDLAAFLATIRERMRACAAQQGLVLACGPLPFLRTIWQYAKECGAKTQLSLENRMACGVGACLGCVTQGASAGSNDTYLQVCTKGPVFWAHDITL